MAYDDVEAEIVDLLENVPALATSERWESDRRWTLELTQRLCALAGQRRLFTCASGIAAVPYATDGEWLWDVTWLRYDPWPMTATNAAVPKALVLAAECEWSPDAEQILNDFEKLLVARADHRLMVFQSIPGRRQGLFDSMKRRIASFITTTSGDRYLLAAWSAPDDRFILKHYVHGDS